MVTSVPEPRRVTRSPRSSSVTVTARRVTASAVDKVVISRGTQRSLWVHIGVVRSASEDGCAVETKGEEIRAMADKGKPRGKGVVEGVRAGRVEYDAMELSESCPTRCAGVVV